MDQEIFTITELSQDDTVGIRGGTNPLTVAAMLVGAFGAGFRFGYSDLAPRIFD